MKNPLLDALRQAQEKGTDLALEDTVATGDQLQTPSLPDPQSSIADASNDNVPLDLELEILDSSNDDVSDTEPAPRESVDSLESAETERSAVSRLKRTLRRHLTQSAATSRSAAPMFERLSVWTPVVCLFLSIVAAIVAASWANLSGDQFGVATATASESAKPSVASELPLYPAETRFPLASSSRASAEPEAIAHIAEPASTRAEGDSP